MTEPNSNKNQYEGCSTSEIFGFGDIPSDKDLKIETLEKELKECKKECELLKKKLKTRDSFMEREIKNHIEKSNDDVAMLSDSYEKVSKESALKDEKIKSLQETIAVAEEKSTRLENEIQKGILRNKEDKEYRTEFDKKLTQLSEDNEKLNEELKSEKEKYLVKEQAIEAHSRIAAELQNKINELSASIINLNEKLLIEIKDKENTQRQIDELNIKKNEYKSELTASNSTIDKLKEKSKTLENYLSNERNENIVLKKENEALNEDLKDLTESSKKLKDELESEKTKSFNMKQEIETLIKDRNTSLVDKNKELNIEREKYKLLERQITQSNEKISSLYKENDMLKAELNQQAKKYLSLEQEIEKINGIYQEFNIMQENIEILEENRDLLSQKLKNKESDLQGAWKELTCTKIRLSCLNERTIDKASNKISQLSSTNKKLTDEIQSKNQIITLYEEDQHNLKKELDLIKKAFDEKEQELNKWIVKNKEIDISLKENERESPSQVIESSLSSLITFDLTEYLADHSFLLGKVLTVNIAGDFNNWVEDRMEKINNSSYEYKAQCMNRGKNEFKFAIYSDDGYKEWYATRKHPRTMGTINNFVSVYN